MLRAGTLRDRIHIQRKTGEKDTWNTPLPGAWQNITEGRIAARVKHLSGLAAIRADADISVVLASIQIRRRAGVTAGMRVVFDSSNYDIEGVLPGETKEDMFLTCKLIQGKAP